MRGHSRVAAAIAIGLCAVAQARVVSASSGVNAIGGGEMVLILSYSQAPQPLPALGCGPTAFTVSGGSQAAIVSVASVTSSGVYDYIGPLTITGSGSSTCENSASALVGNMTLSIVSADGGVGMSCASMAGAFTRQARLEIVELSGSCRIQGVTLQVSLFSGTAYEPLQGDGVTSAVTQAALEGVLTTAA
jgi:hypothetical protein